MTTLRFLIILLLVLNALTFAAISGWLGDAPRHGESGRLAAQLAPERIRLDREQAPGSGLAATPADPAPALWAPASLSPPDAEVPATDTPDTPSALARAADEDVGSPLADADAEAEAGVGDGPPDAAAPAASEPQVSAATPTGPVAATEPLPVCQAWANLGVNEADRLSQRLRRIDVTPVRVRTETPESWWVRIPPQRSRAEAERRVVELNLQGVTDTFIVQEAGPSQHAVSLGLFKTEARARVLLGQLRAKGVTGAGIEPRMTVSYRIQATLPPNELRAVESAAPGLRSKRQACTPR